MMIIDGHAHACGIYLHEKSIIEHMKKERIDKVILSAGQRGSKTNYNLPALGKLFRSSKLIYGNNRLTTYIIGHSNVLSYLDEENERLAQLAMKYKSQIFNTYWVNMNEENYLKKLEAFDKKWPFALIKLHQCWTPFQLQDKKSDDLFQFADKKHKPIFIHMSTNEQVRQFIQIAKRYPKVPFIVAHLIGVEEFNKENVGGNIYFDISCPELHSMEMLRRAYELVGANRILLGSDTPYGKHNVAKAISKIEKLGVTQEEKAAICGLNILRLINES